MADIATLNEGQKVNVQSKNGDSRFKAIIVKVLKREDRVIVKREDDEDGGTVKVSPERIFKRQGRPAGSTNRKTEEKVEKVEKKPKRAASSEIETLVDEIEDIKDTLDALMERLEKLQDALKEMNEEEEEEEEEKPSRKVVKGGRKPMSEDD